MAARIIERTDILALHPHVGHPVHEVLDLDVREVHVASYRIVYRVRLDEVEIVTLVHFAQQLKLKRPR